jgi:hypothetical protein
MTKTIGCALGLLTVFALASCYNTNSIKNGGLVCGTGRSCPSGFACVNDGPSGHCWKNGIVLDAGVTTACTVDVAKTPYGPFATCSANVPIPSSTCDPVCQAGCPCNHRCVLDDATNTSFICESSAPAAGTAFVQPLGSCNSPNLDLCAPGSVCINDDLCQNLCYRTCRTDDDCGSGSSCGASGIQTGSTTLANLFFCSPPVEICDPTGIATCGTARANFNCVFLAGLTGIVNTDNTVCDCSTLHDKVLGQACSLLPDDCRPGLVCVGAAGSAICHRVCNLQGSGSACLAGGGCTPLYNSKSYGYCR